MESRSGLEVWLSRVASLLLGLGLLAVLVLGLGPHLLPYHTFTVYSGSMAPTIPIGAEILDLLVPAENIRPGDVITFPDPDHPDRLVTHRVIRLQPAGTKVVALTKGDANGVPDSWKIPLNGRTLRMAVNVPYLGYALNALQQPLTRLLFLILVGLLAILFIRQLWLGDPDPEDKY